MTVLANTFFVISGISFAILLFSSGMQIQKEIKAKISSGKTVKYTLKK